MTVRNDARGRYELEVDGQLAQLVFRMNGERLVLVHTEVPDALEGQGVGSRLVRAAVDDARDRNLIIVPVCPFARAWLERHPDVAATVRIDWPKAESKDESKDA
jgi:uncharacterized protein